MRNWSDEIQQLREASQWNEALKTLEDALLRQPQGGETPDFSSAVPEWYSHVLKRCLLLDAARGLRGKSSPTELLGLLDRIRIASDPNNHHRWRAHPYVNLLDARRELIKVALADLTANEIAESVIRAIDLYRGAWKDPREEEPQYTSTAGRPAWYDSLPNAKFRRAFGNLAETYGPCHPALALCAETIGYIWPKSDGRLASEDLPASYKIRTWILLADTWSRTGVLGRLHLERVEGGCGVIYPHPLYGGYRLTDAQFQQSFSHAWLAAMRSVPANQHFDVRWWIELVNPADHQLDMPIAGRSAELAIACGILALHKKEPLDESTAITACFLDPGKGDFSIDKVNSVRAKASAPQLTDILVADGQEIECEVDVTQSGQRLTIGARQVTLSPVKNLNDAYERISRWPMMTRHVCRAIANREAKLLRERCGEVAGRTNYVASSLSRELPPERHSIGEDGERIRWEPLSKRQVRKIRTGTIGKGRGIRLIADSGLGKTTFMIHSSHAIARLEDGRLPLRRDKLSAYDWRTPSSLLKKFAGQFKPLLPKSYRRFANKWFRRLVNQGKVVFLLDALDQTTNPLDGIEEFFDEGIGAARKCAAVLTGRPSVVRGGLSRVFHGRHWEPLRVDPFDEPRQRVYLGSFARELLWIDDIWGRPARYDQWSALLGVPLLLRLLHRLVQSGRIEALTNRHSLYEAAVLDLYTKGAASLVETNLASAHFSLPQVRKVLEEAAWKMLCLDNFSGQLTGDAFDRLVDSLGEVTIARLQQVNLLTSESILDEAGAAGLAWRHLSFCEYFAGVHFAGLSPKEQTDTVKVHAREEQWQWTFRFALSEAAAKRDVARAKENESEAQAQQAILIHLAESLLRYGNPFLLFDAIRGDRIELDDKDLENLCRWLVHREWSPNKDYQGAWDGKGKRPVLDDRVLVLLTDLFDRQYRDSRSLHPAWELLKDSQCPKAIKIRETFLGEFQKLVTNSNQVARQLLPDEKSWLLEEPARKNRPHLREDLRNFMPCPPTENGDHSGLLVQTTQVTNAQFELFDPGHDRWRNEYSSEPDQPAIYVSWYMAQMFCRWRGDGCGLPSEADWELACRAGSTTAYCFGDDEEQLGEHAWYRGNAGGKTHPVGQLKPNAWGLYDMHGNVCERCDGKYAPDRVIRGGGWFLGARYCRSAYRYGYEPWFRYGYLGFRLARSSGQDAER